MEQISTHVSWHSCHVDRSSRALLKNQQPVVLWFTGFSASGKSTIANAVDAILHAKGRHTYLLDGDNVRHGLNGDLGFSDRDRVENIRRIGEVSKLFADAGLIVLTAFISPFQQERLLVRRMLDDREFIEVHVDTPLAVCEQRDPKGLYSKARAGEIKNFTGIDSEYERPDQPEIRLQTSLYSIEECAQQVVSYLLKHGYLKE